MSTPLDVQALVKRVVGRVLAERGAEARPERAAGVFVTVQPGGETPRPVAPERQSSAGRGPDLVTVEMIARVERGGSLRVPSGAIVTDLARDEAWRRGIRLEERATTDAGRLRVAIAADHGGFRLKTDVVEWVRGLGHEAFDLGTRDENAVDYPDYARAVAESVASRNADLGIVIDGAGIGSAMAANKVPGVRAANCWNVAAARNAREHNYANVLTLGAKMISALDAHDVVRAFLSTPLGEERHQKRVKKITDIERAYGRVDARSPQ